MKDEKNDKLCINYSCLCECKFCSGYDIKCKHYESKVTRMVEIFEIIGSKK